MITIVIPVYNVEPYLRRCIDSILSQTFQDFELILVDDGSPDGCGHICDEYALKSPRIRVIHKKNGGLSDARNSGLFDAQGEYIAFIDSDDWVAPSFLSDMMEALQDTEADICECEVLRTSGEEGERPNPGIADVPVRVFNTEEALKELISDRILHQHVWNKLYRREVLQGILFEKGRTNEDEFWTYQVFGRAKKVVKIDKALYYYFQRPGSIMGETFSLKRLDALDAKMARQAYIEGHFPSLSGQARLNLYGSCIYAGQMSLKYLDQKDIKTAREKINSIRTEIPDISPEIRKQPLKQRLWLRLSKASFWGTVKLKNLLRRGF